MFVAAHTSAGKTVVAEYAIALSLQHLTRWGLGKGVGGWGGMGMGGRLELNWYTIIIITMIIMSVN